MAFIGIVEKGIFLLTNLTIWIMLGMIGGYMTSVFGIKSRRFFFNSSGMLFPNFLYFSLLVALLQCSACFFYGLCYASIEDFCHRILCCVGES